MATTKKATYRRYNGADWDTIAFATLSSVVTTDGLTSTVYLGNGQTLSSMLSIIDVHLNTINEDCGTLSNDISDLKVTVSDHTTDIASLKSADSALDTRISKIEGAYTDGTIITTSNMGEKITKVGTVASGKWQGTAIEDAYIASASKWSAKQDALKWDTAPTANSTNPVTSGGVKTAIDTVTAIAQGKTNTYVITTGSSTSDANIVNNDFFVLQTNEAKTQVSIAYKTLTTGITTVNNKTIYLSDLKVGDIILTQEANIKDFYVGLIASGTITFYEIDSDKPDLTDYAKTSEVTSKISAAIQALDSSKDAGSGKYLQSITIADGKITGGTTGTIPTSLPASNTTSDYSSTGTAPVNGTAVSKALGQSVSKTATGNGLTVTIGGTIQSPTLAVSAAAGSVASGNSAVVSGGTVYNYVSARATKVYYQASSSTPTGMIEGDIWIAY